MKLMACPVLKGWDLPYYFLDITVRMHVKVLKTVPRVSEAFKAYSYFQRPWFALGL